MEAASARGWHATDLVVQGTGAARNTVRVLDAPVEPGPNPMLLTLFISPDSLEVGTGASRLPPLPLDWSALSQQLLDIKASFPDHRFLRIGASPEVTVADLVAALDVSGKKDERWLFDEHGPGRSVSIEHRTPLERRRDERGDREEVRV